MNMQTLDFNSPYLSCPMRLLASNYLQLSPL